MATAALVLFGTVAVVLALPWTFMRQTYARHVLVLAVLAAISAGPGAAVAVRAQSLDREVEATLRSLYKTTPEARELAPSARGILVFPDIFRENYYYTFGVQSGN